MKTFRKVGMAIVAVLLCGSMAACSEDDEDGDGGGTGIENVTLATPDYEEHAALYELDGNGEWQSIELTASGNYIITENFYYSASKMLKPELSKESPIGRSLKMLNNGVRPTRSSYNGIIYGTYTVNEDGTYVLEGFGTIELVGSEDNAVSLVVTTPDGVETTMTAEKKTQAPQSAITNALCRTWKVKGFRMVIKFNGKKMLDETGYIDNLEDFVNRISDKIGEDLTMEDIFGEVLPEEVVFTKAGTYMVSYDNQMLAVSTWAWENMSTGLLRYSWNYDDMYDEEMAGTAWVSFKNNDLYLNETYKETEDGDTYEEQAITILSAK